MLEKYDYEIGVAIDNSSDIFAKHLLEEYSLENIIIKLIKYKYVGIDIKTFD